MSQPNNYQSYKTISLNQWCSKFLSKHPPCLVSVVLLNKLQHKNTLLGVILSTRGIQTLDFSRKTINAVLSDLQIVDVVKQFCKKLKIRSSRDLLIFCNFQPFYPYFFNFRQNYLVVRPLIYFGGIPCSCRAKIEAEQIHKLWIEHRICNFL